MKAATPAARARRRDEGWRCAWPGFRAHFLAGRDAAAYYRPRAFAGWPARRYDRTRSDFTGPARAHTSWRVRHVNFADFFTRSSKFTLPIFRADDARRATNPFPLPDADYNIIFGAAANAVADDVAAFIAQKFSSPFDEHATHDADDDAEGYLLGTALILVQQRRFDYFSRRRQSPPRYRTTACRDSHDARHYRDSISRVSTIHYAMLTGRARQAPVSRHFQSKCFHFVSRPKCAHAAAIEPAPRH